MREQLKRSQDYATSAIDNMEFTPNVKQVKGAV
jgi:hypothetical protein